jgi:acetyl-CoA carboxylase, biotin carboxylase subunit
LKKVLIANRGEIAVRIIRGCKELGIRTVSIFSDVDKFAPHVIFSDEAYPLDGISSADTYLNISKIIDISKKSGVDAIHPGYGFLAENAEFRNSCDDAGIVFIGPSTHSMEVMGDKVEARKLMKKAGVPYVPGTLNPIIDETELFEKADEIGFPIMLKAVAGGGGKGMRIVKSKEELVSSSKMAQSEALTAFGDGSVYIEKYLHKPRHIEFQILADMYGNYVYLGERECSIQRRHQKVIEETPSPVLNDELRKKMGEKAVDCAKAAGYFNAGTIEFLYDSSGNFYFLEMNTRLQVEHPITELVTGIDIVKYQMKIASGEKLDFTQDDVKPRGVAIECRIYAEDPDNNFFPSPGIIHSLREPSGPGIRNDSGIFEGSEISIYYDPLISKLCALGKNRIEAIEKMKRALSEYLIIGVKTTIPFHLLVMNNTNFLKGNFDTHFIDDDFNKKETICNAQLEDVALFGSIIAYLEEQQKSDFRKTEKCDSSLDPWSLFGRNLTFKSRL